MNLDKTKVMFNEVISPEPISINGEALEVVQDTAGERAHDARRPAVGNRKSHPVVGGISLTPRYSPRPRLESIRPAAAPPEEPPDLGPPDQTTEPGKNSTDTALNVHAHLSPLPMKEAPAGPT
ncbi:unnamed protein product, partial [Iphiclides podalirius]